MGEDDSGPRLGGERGRLGYRLVVRDRLGGEWGRLGCKLVVRDRLGGERGRLGYRLVVRDGLVSQASGDAALSWRSGVDGTERTATGLATSGSSVTTVSGAGVWVWSGSWACPWGS